MITLEAYKKQMDRPMRPRYTDDAGVTSRRARASRTSIADDLVGMTPIPYKFVESSARRGARTVQNLA
jgi:hypothetical protein